MKRQFCIVSDGSCDLPAELAGEREVFQVPFYVSFDGKDYKRESDEIDLRDFYQRMVDEPDVFPRTAAPSPEDFYRVMEERARMERNILCICISTKLSASVQSAGIAKRMLEEKYPDVRVEVVDSLATTLMQGVFVLEACRLRDMGYSMEETAETLRGLIRTGRILFTVGNLSYLQHGGRIGKVTSIAGNLLDIKPLITLQNGEIHSSGIRRGRRKSLTGVLELLVRYLKENQYRPEDCNIALGYCHDLGEAQRLKKLTEERLRAEFGGTQEIPIYQIGAIIGVHAGPLSIGYGVICRSDLYERD